MSKKRSYPPAVEDGRRSRRYRLRTVTQQQPGAGVHAAGDDCIREAASAHTAPPTALG
jgi:hypothetical protein